MAELSRAEAYIAGPKGREYAAVALDRADSSAEPLAWEVGGRSPAYLPSHVAANAGFGAEPKKCAERTSTVLIQQDEIGVFLMAS